MPHAKILYDQFIKFSPSDVNDYYLGKIIINIILFLFHSSFFIIWINRSSRLWRCGWRGGNTEHDWVSSDVTWVFQMPRLSFQDALMMIMPLTGEHTRYLNRPEIGFLCWSDVKLSFQVMTVFRVWRCSGSVCPQVGAVIKIQAFFRASKARGEYRMLGKFT